VDEWAPGSLWVQDAWKLLIGHRFLPAGMDSGLRDGAASSRDAELTLVNPIFIAVPKNASLKMFKI
jgi:hypothetical protein